MGATAAEMRHRSPLLSRQSAHRMTLTREPKRTVSCATAYRTTQPKVWHRASAGPTPLPEWAKRGAGDGFVGKAPVRWKAGERPARKATK